MIVPCFGGGISILVGVWIAGKVGDFGLEKLFLPILCSVSGSRESLMWTRKTCLLQSAQDGFIQTVLFKVDCNISNDILDDVFVDLWLQGTKSAQ